MPELPEVETVKRGLNRLAQGICVKDVTVTWPAIVQISDELTDFRQAMRGQTLQDVERRGKFLIFNWSDVIWVSHLRMEGKYLLPEHKEVVDKYTHVILELEDGRDLRYRDVRKFGRIKCYPKQQKEAAINALHLGPEPQEVTGEELFNAFQRTKRAIKPCLLDQHIIAGIGNIYADEILWESQIHPETLATNLSEAQCVQLAAAMATIIKRAIEKGGTTVRTYTNALGENGHYQDELKVYGREGLPCARCHNTIEKIKVAQRGTHFCPYCQRIGE